MRSFFLSGGSDFVPLISRELAAPAYVRACVPLGTYPNGHAGGTGNERYSHREPTVCFSACASRDGSLGGGHAGLGELFAGRQRHRIQSVTWPPRDAVTNSPDAPSERQQCQRRRHRVQTVERKVMKAISQRSSEGILCQQCTKSKSPFLHDGDLGSLATRHKFAFSKMRFCLNVKFYGYL
jgi:hypothetical protein